jgi:hypothetical protein
MIKKPTAPPEDASVDVSGVPEDVANISSKKLKNATASRINTKEESTP